jgi:ubiquinone/menaquinone biosynthesis C-methylase UbiE
MRAAWNRFAVTDPMFHIHTWQEDWDPDAFFATGAEHVNEWMAWIGDRIERRRMLDIGCGLGRMTVAFAREFEQVDGVDISTKMIEQARAFDPPPNVHYSVIPGDSLDGIESSAYDFVGSLGVFQHIPDEAAIAGYLNEIARVLQPNGHALLQFNTAPIGMARKIAHMLPDPLLPRTNRRYMRCYRRDPGRIRQLVDGARMEIVWEHQAGDATFHYFFLRKPPSQV